MLALGEQQPSPLPRGGGDQRLIFAHPNSRQASAASSPMQPRIGSHLSNLFQQDIEI
jgi:hypothetical protein